MSKTGKTAYFYLSVVFFIFFDAFFSDILLKNITRFPENSVIDLIYIQNRGAAFSMLQDSMWFLIGFSAIAILYILYYVTRNIKKYSVIALFWSSMLSAGIFCNMYERISLGYVRDFFKMNFVNFPVFNISDIFINVSVFAIVVMIIKYNFSKNNETGSR